MADALPSASVTASLKRRPGTPSIVTDVEPAAPEVVNALEVVKVYQVVPSSLDHWTTHVLVSLWLA